MPKMEDGLFHLRFGMIIVKADDKKADDKRENKINILF